MAPGHRCHSGWANLPNRVRACAAPRPLPRTSRHRPAAAPPTRDSPGPHEKDLRHRMEDSRHRGFGRSSRLFSHPGAKRLRVPIPPTGLAPEPRGQAHPELGSMASVGSTSFVPKFSLLASPFEFSGNKQWVSQSLVWLCLLWILESPDPRVEI